MAPRKGLGRFHPFPYLQSRFLDDPQQATGSLSIETVYSRNGTSERDQRNKGAEERTLPKGDGGQNEGTKETVLEVEQSDSVWRTPSSCSPLSSCWLVVSVEWRSYRLPWKESRANSSPSRFFPLFSSRILPSLVGCCFILQFSWLGYNLRYALKHLCFSLYGATLCR